MCDRWTHIQHLSLKLSAHLEMAGISPSFMSYPPAVFSCHYIPASTAQQKGLRQEKFFFHHFLAPLLVLSLSLCNSALSQAQRRGCSSVLVDQTLQYSIPLSCNKCRGIKGRLQCISKHEIFVWECVPRASWLKFCPVIKLHQIRTTVPSPLSAALVLGKDSDTKYQFTTMCQSLQTLLLFVIQCTRFQMQLWFIYVHVLTERGKLCAFTKVKAWWTQSSIKAKFLS